MQANKQTTKQATTQTKPDSSTHFHGLTVTKALAELSDRLTLHIALVRGNRSLLLASTCTRESAWSPQCCLIHVLASSLSEAVAWQICVAVVCNPGCYPKNKWLCCCGSQYFLTRSACSKPLVVKNCRTSHEQTNDNQMDVELATTMIRQHACTLYTL